MVMLHGLERGRSDVRPTADVDVLVDIRVRPGALRAVVRFLSENGLEPEVAPEGIQHRFKRGTDDGDLKVDVLAPDHVGVRADLAFLLAILPEPRRVRSELTSKERAKLCACELQNRDHRAWRVLPESDVNNGHAALQLLSAQ